MVRDNKLTSGHNNDIPPRTKALMAVIAIVTLIAILLVPDEKEEAPPAEPTTKECPFCFSTISIKAKKCGFCTSELGSTA